ncbi:MAG: hypothetical protein IKU19_01135 [Clostridia bacterium]|nr:hypothetical protein [Clostridia bacterium]
MDENNKLQGSFIYIVLGLLLAVFVAASVTAVKCYTPYSFRAGVSTELKGVLWSILLMPSVMLPIALWFSNILKPTLSRISLVSVLMVCCYFIAVPRLYKLFDPADMAITTSALAFFLMSCCITVVIKDIKKKSTKRWINITIGIILTLAFILLSGYAIYFIINFSLMDRIVVCVVTPILCLVYAVGSLLDIYTKPTVILNTLAIGYATLCSAFEIMNESYLFYILAGLLCLSVIWQIIDIIKYIRSKENDSESCNA